MLARDFDRSLKRLEHPYVGFKPLIQLDYNVIGCAASAFKHPVPSGKMCFRQRDEDLFVSCPPDAGGRAIQLFLKTFAFRKPLKG